MALSLTEPAWRTVAIEFPDRADRWIACVGAFCHEMDRDGRCPFCSKYSRLRTIFRRVSTYIECGVLIRRQEKYQKNARLVADPVSGLRGLMACLPQDMSSSRDPSVKYRGRIEVLSIRENFR